MDLSKRFTKMILVNIIFMILFGIFDYFSWMQVMKAVTQYSNFLFFLNWKLFVITGIVITNHYPLASMSYLNFPLIIFLISIIVNLFFMWKSERHE